MKRTPRQLLIYILFTLLFVGTIAYGYSRYNRVRKGPVITHINLEPYQNISERWLTLEGKVANTQTLEINNNNILMSDEGEFTVTTPLSPGYNTIDIYQQDGFGTKNHHTYTVYSQATHKTKN